MAEGSIAPNIADTGGIVSTENSGKMYSYPLRIGVHLNDTGWGCRVASAQTTGAFTFHTPNARGSGHPAVRGPRNPAVLWY